jgi:virginiamycin A acetyltransferase
MDQVTSAPMLLSEKERLFLGGGKQPAQDLDPGAGVRIRNPAPGATCEHAVSVSSPILGAGHFFVGAHSYMNDGGYIRLDQGGVFIGRYCSVGRRVTIGAGTHSMTGLSTSPALRGSKSLPYTPEQRELVHSGRPAIAPIVIGSDVWIGDGAVIMAGVRIGPGAIIAANAVVTKSVEPYRIVGGVPAKTIGVRFASDVSVRLTESQWWECGHDYLNTLPQSSVFQFLDSFKFSPALLPTFRLP